MFFKVCNHREINPDKKFSMILESGGEDQEFEIHRPLNMFGGIMNQYEPDKGVPIIPLIVGQISPGMLISYISAMTTIAVEMLKETQIPEKELRKILDIAINEGLKNKVEVCKCKH